MLEIISSEVVKLDDGLPQFICTSCLFYLHHAYEIHLKIRESSLTSRTALLLLVESPSLETRMNLEEIQPLDADNESETDEEDEFILPPTPKPQTNNKNKKKKLEIAANFPKINIAQEITILESEGHAPIKLKNYRNPLPYTERKCNACFHRSLDQESFDKHIANCIILTLDQLFFYLQDLRNMRLASQLDHDEFLLRAISAIRAIQEKCNKFWKEKGLSNIVLSDTNVVFDEASAKINHDYHKMKHSKYTNELIMNDIDDSINLHFAQNNGE